MFGAKVTRNARYIGRKPIIAYLKPLIGLSDDQKMAWQKIRRWRIKYGLPVESQPNTSPYLDPATFEAWWQAYLEQKKSISST